MAKPKNAACCPDCTCDCCKCTCPYCTLSVLIDQLVAKKVSPDVAAQVASSFVECRCTQNCPPS